EAALLDYVNGGGSIFAASGPRSSGLGRMPLLGIPVNAQAVSNTRQTAVQITRVDTSHPVLRDSAGWAGVNARTLSVSPAIEDRVLVAQSSSNPVLLERNIGAGRMLLLTTSLDNSASDLPVRPVFVGFMAEVARYLSNEN